MRKRWYSILSAGAIAIGAATFGMASASASTPDCLALGPVCGTNVNVFGNAFDVDQQNFTENSSIISWPNGNDRATDFIRTSPSAGVYRYEIAPNGIHSGLCVSDPDGGVPGKPAHGLLERVCNTGNWQRFRVGVSGSGGKQLVNIATARVVTTNGTGEQITTGGSYTDGSYWTWKGGASPTPTPTPTPTTPTPTPTPTTFAWCSTDPNGFQQFGPYGVFNGEWNATNTQKICANSGADWQATVNQPNGNTEIKTYPDVQLNYNSPPLISSLNPAATSSFAETMNANAGTSAEAGYDIWINVPGQSDRTEVMIWTDTVNRGTVGGASLKDTATFNGMTWQLWMDGGELIWYPPNNVNMHSGTVYPAQMLQWLQSHGYLSSSATIDQFEYGFEVASTGGVNENFRVTNFSTTGLPAGN